MSDAAFLESAERLAEAFRARYGVTDAWSDAQIDGALHEHNLPCLGLLPDEPRGMMIALATPRDLDGSPTSRRAWQRTNAMHLLGHAILHNGERCDGCQDWGEPR